MSAIKVRLSNVYVPLRTMSPEPLNSEDDEAEGPGGPGGPGGPRMLYK